MIVFPPDILRSTAAEVLKARAETGVFDPTPRVGEPLAYWEVKNRRYMDACTGLHKFSGSYLIFTRDTGHHRCGWWKNPEYESCYHLSISYLDPETLDPILHHDRKMSLEWIDHFFGDWKRYLWEESPKTEGGQILQVYHYRVFVDEHWQPIIPRGEVYSRKLTEAGWKSFSEVNADADRWDLQGVGE